MFCRDARFSRLRDERVARLYSKSLLLSKLFVILNDFWISNKDYGINTKKTRRSNLVFLFSQCVLAREICNLVNIQMNLFSFILIFSALL